MVKHERPALEELLRLAPHLEIAHHIPGRIRLKILISALHVLHGVDIRAMVLRVPGVLGMRLNASARSVVIDYNQDQFPYELWQMIEQLGRNPEMARDVATRLNSLLDARPE